MSVRRLTVWVGATTVAYALGTMLGVTLVGATARAIAPVLGGMVFVAVFGAVIGIGVGAVQFAALPRGAVSLRGWMLATVLGAAAGFVVAAPVGEALGNIISPTGNIVIGGGTIEISSGAIVGLGIGLAQSRVLGAFVPTPRWWVIACVVGTGLGYGAATAILELLEVPILKSNLIPAFGAITGILVGLAQVLVLAASPGRLARHVE
jgi:hypothetical protein